MLANIATLETLLSLNPSEAQQYFGVPEIPGCERHPYSD